MIITKDTTFHSRSCTFIDKAGKGVIVVGADDITLDGNGLTLDGRDGRGYGIVLNGHKGVTITNFKITGYHYAIKIENTERIVVRNSLTWNNGAPEERVYDINRPISSSYGGGILVRGTRNSTFVDNTGYSENVGIDMYESSNNTINGNNFSNCLAWGIRLYDSSFNTLSSNRADHVGGQSTKAPAHRDTAGILLVWSSHGNTIVDNIITDCGDGLFIGNEHGLPSNNNLIERNDASYAVHNSFEATFSEGNVFRGNIANHSNYGFWLGFSHHSTVESNTVSYNRVDGINWEHGRFGRISDNDIRSNGRHGVALTLKPHNPLTEQYPGSERSHNFEVAQNSIVGNRKCGVYFFNTTDSNIEGNTIHDNEISLLFEEDSDNNVVVETDLH